MNMTDEQMKIAIAEACGIKVYRRGDILGWRNEAFEHHPCKGNGSELPDYLNDLNAMHEAEKALCSSDCAKYRDSLSQNTNIFDDMVGACIDWRLVHATARQRAIAFIKTLNLEPK